MSAEALAIALSLCRAGHYYDAHEVLEVECWRPCQDPSLKRFLQAWIQWAVAYTHFQRGNRKGCLLLLKKAQGHLRSLALDFKPPTPVPPEAVAFLLQAIGDHLQALEEERPISFTSL